jgi:GTP-binding protein HflX
LARAIGLNVVHQESVALARLNPGTFFGSGTVDRLSAVVAEARRAGDAATVVVFVDSALSPVQQRNLERRWNAKVVDRSGLILEIFGERARTAEGELQVELATLSYQKSRLVRSWTHLERQRGGYGFLGGPGEAQIETDRRLIRDRIASLRRQLDKVRRTRTLHRRARQRVPYPAVAVVGYTNAGKSTLFNRLTRAGVFVADQVFATLDPTMRGVDLPSGRRAVLSDTVGFISDLPHELVEAFRATLEEVIEADVILHVRDVSVPWTDQEKADVETVLASLGAGAERDQPVIEVLNKRDLLPADEQISIANRLARGGSPAVLVSARSGDGCDALLAMIDEVLARGNRLLRIRLSPADGAELAWLYEFGEVLERHDSADAIIVTVRLAPAEAERFYRQHGAAAAAALAGASAVAGPPAGD